MSDNDMSGWARLAARNVWQGGNVQGDAPPGMTILDCNGTPIRVGARVLEYHTRQECGTVTELTEPDADYDDELGRAVAYGPYVFVSYDDGQSDRYTATWNATGPWDSDCDEFTCDDVEVARLSDAWSKP